MSIATCGSCERERKIRARGLCGSCYEKHRRDGLPLPPKVRRTWREYLAASQGPPGTCWLWAGAVDAEGYGLAFTEDGRTYAHRTAYTLAHGDIPDGLTVDHLCRNRACVNPDHLEAVTRGENLRRAVPYRSAQVPRLGHGNCTHGDVDIYTDPTGKRVCRPCRRERTRLWRNDRKNL